MARHLAANSRIRPFLVSKQNDNSSQIAGASQSSWHSLTLFGINLKFNTKRWSLCLALYKLMVTVGFRVRVRVRFRVRVGVRVEFRVRVGFRVRVSVGDL